MSPTWTTKRRSCASMCFSRIGYCSSSFGKYGASPKTPKLNEPGGVGTAGGMPPRAMTIASAPSTTTAAMTIQDLRDTAAECTLCGMKAIRIEKNGGPEVLTLADVAIPEPKPNEAVVKISASGVNFIDVYFREGRYPAQLPITLGQEAAGTVTAVGADVRDVKPGDRVAYASVQGSYAESAAVPAERLVIVPDGIDLKVAAAVMLQGMTAHYLTHSTYPLRAGETAIVHAAAGGVGLLLVQLAKAIGAHVIGTAGSP